MRTRVGFFMGIRFVCFSDVGVSCGGWFAVVSTRKSNMKRGHLCFYIALLVFALPLRAEKNEKKDFSRCRF